MVIGTQIVTWCNTFVNQIKSNTWALRRFDLGTRDRRHARALVCAPRQPEQIIRVEPQISIPPSSCAAKCQPAMHATASSLSLSPCLTAGERMHLTILATHQTQCFSCRRRTRGMLFGVLVTNKLSQALNTYWRRAMH